MGATNEQKPSGRLRGVSLGPGSPDLITVRALDVLRRSHRIYYPAASQAGAAGQSRCFAIIRHYGLEGTAKPFEVNMKSTSTADYSYRLVREVLLGDLNKGLDVAIVCEGCLSLYSTAFQILCDDVFSGRFELIPGVSSLSAASVSSDVCLGIGSDKIAVIPGLSSRREIESAVDSFETVVVVKPSRSGGIADIIKEKNLEFVYCRDIGGAGHFITGDPADIENGEFPYFSLFIISKKLNRCPAA